jgi:integrase/recombinase XerD
VNITRGERFGALRPETIYAKVRSLKAGLGPASPGGWTPHWFRHSHATSLLLAGVPAHVVMRRLGHRNVETTLNRYGWVTEDAELAALANWKDNAARWRLSEEDSPP